MTRKDYNALADAIKAQRDIIVCAPPVAVAAADAIAKAVANVCAQDNPRFDRNRFLIACGVPLDGRT